MRGSRKFFFHSKIFYWPFQGGTSFVDLLCFCSVLCLLCFVRVCLYVLCGHLLGKGCPLGSRLWFVVSTVSLSLSHWYPGSGVVLDCIDSWSLHPYLLFSKPCLVNLISKDTHLVFSIYSSFYKQALQSSSVLQWHTENGPLLVVFGNSCLLIN